MICIKCGEPLPPNSHADRKYCPDCKILQRRENASRRWQRMSPEDKKARNRADYLSRKTQRRKNVNPRVKVEIVWPGCCLPEIVSLTRYQEWMKAGAIPEGTAVKLEAK